MASEKPKPERKPRLIAQAVEGRKQRLREGYDDPKTERFQPLTEGLDAIDKDSK